MRVSTFFTTIFVTIDHLYSTFASPIASEEGVAAGQSLNLTHALAKRNWYPVDQLCDEPEDWTFRVCFSAHLDQAYMDECVNIDGDVYWKLGACPRDIMCMNTFGPPPNYSRTAICMNRPLNSAGNPSGNPPANGQVGYYRLAEQGISTPAVSVELVRAVKGAAVSAFI